MAKLDYVVTFPPRHVARSDSEAGGSRLWKDGLEAPVVYLFGWYGCRDKYLAKYSAMYESVGFITIRYILPHEYLFGRKMNQIRSVALKVLDALFELELEEHPIFFHTFSNGGAALYRHVTEILNGTSPGCYYRSLKIAGIILDSSPSRPDISRVFRVVYGVFLQSHHWIVAYLKAYLTWMFMWLSAFLTRLGFRDIDSEATYSALLSDQITCPQFFLYSKADPVVYYQDVQGVIAARRRGGFEVQEVMWEDSGHVNHLRTHPEEYAAACREFTTHCLDKLKSPPSANY